MCVTLSLNDANIACYQAEMFPTEVRYTGAALGSNIAYVVFGGTASFVATALIDATRHAHASFLHDGHQRGGRRYPVLHSSRL